jgi:DNA-binding response OmpR family regulator
MKKMRILVVESEIPTAMLMTSLLTQAGLDVQVAAKGRKGLEIAQEQKFDLVLLETSLPDISSFKICAELKQRHISYRTPIIFLSNQRGDEHREQALELGATAFIEKPFDAKDFIACVLSHLKPLPAYV